MAPSRWKTTAAAALIEHEKRFNWELVFCELYAGGKYNDNQGGDYDFSLGTNGLGSCATQYASEYMDVTVWRDGNKYSLHFKKGKVVGAKKKALQIDLPTKTEPAPPSSGVPTLRSSLPLIFLPTGIAKPCVARLLLTPTSLFVFVSKAPMDLPKRISAIPGASRTMF